MDERRAIARLKHGDIAGQHELQAAIERALLQLTAEQRAVIVMRYYLDYSEQKIAEELDRPAGTVKSRLHAARRQLRGPEPRRLGAPLRLNRALGLTALILMFGVVVLMQGIIDLDPGLRGERAAELVTPLGVSQEHGGITVTLDWAYADANRLVLSYTVGGERITGPWVFAIDVP